MSGETERNISGWTVDTLRLHLISVVDERDAKLEAADTAAGLRNEQRFIAQQQAIKDALISQKEAVAAALAAAEKAVLVAEANAERWRGAANEWRGAMNDRERTLMPRSEAEQRLQAIAESCTQGAKANADKIEALSKIVEKGTGRREGLMIVFVAIAAIAALVSIVIAIRAH